MELQHGVSKWPSVFVYVTIVVGTCGAKNDDMAIVKDEFNSLYTYGVIANAGGEGGMPQFPPTL